MLFVWRGIGIAVPIVFFLIGWIVSYWFKDTTLGNGTYIGWVCLYSAIVCLLLGAAALGMGKSETNENGTSAPKKKHDFFFVPVIFWAGIFGALSAWLLLSGGEKKDSLAGITKDPVADTIRMLRFYNPTPDTLMYVLSDKYGYFEKEKLKPYSSIERYAPKSSYLLAGMRKNGESTLALPGKKDFDTTKYEKVKEGDTFIYQRTITRPTKEANDYDDAWVLLSSGFDMVVINISDLYEGKLLKKEKIAGIKWIEKIHSKHPGDELIEPFVKPAAGETVNVINPNTLLPVSCREKEAVYILITYPFNQELTNEFISGEISRLVL
ncbi:MAG: hypothetical protein K0S33_2967 [Bacteroidetes bacterium]|jgi:hypothetical protein|nr:hypothetical protein [Bacteroidota bacterium]